MWLERCCTRIRAHKGPVIVVGSADSGINHVIAELGNHDRSLVWVALDASDAGSPVAQGDRLAEAVQHGLGSRLFGSALPFSYGISVLKTYIEAIRDTVFALSGADYGIELAEQLLDLDSGERKQVVLQFNALPAGFSLPMRALLLGPEDLTVSWAEALELAGQRVREDCLRDLWQRSNGSYVPFITMLHQELSLPQPLYPSPVRLQSAQRRVAGADTDSELHTLLAGSQWLEALEYAQSHIPEHVRGILELAEDDLQVSVPRTRLYALLSQLPPQLRHDDRILKNLLLAAIDLGKERDILPEVQAVLARRDAPELRAVYAEVRLRLGDLDGYQQQAEQAVQARETLQTLYTYGRSLSLRDPEAGVAPLERGLRLTEQADRHYWAAQFALALAARQATLGHYRTAANWAEWGQQVYVQGAFQAAPLRLQLLSEWAFARILLGEQGGLDSILRKEAQHLEHAHPGLARTFQTTLADLLLSIGREDEARAIYRRLWETNRRREHLGALANLYVHALLQNGECDQALRVAERALELSNGLHCIYRRRAMLAYGMAVSWQEPARAIPILEEAMGDLAQPMLAPRMAQGAFYLARAHLLLDASAKAGAVLDAARPVLSGLGDGGIRYLGGISDAFHPVLALWKADRAPLELRFLGRSEARLRGETLPLRLRFAEFLAVLTLQPAGLSLEQLTLAVYGEEGIPMRCKTEICRLRQIMPIENKPYRIGLPVWADFVQIPILLRSGRIMEALSLYQGPLLPASEAPEIAATREYLEVALRNAVLASRDPEALWTLAERLGDDLELWEAILAALSPGDPRYFLAAARVTSVQRAWNIEPLRPVSGQVLQRRRAYRE